MTGKAIGQNWLAVGLLAALTVTAVGAHAEDEAPIKLSDAELSEQVGGLRTPTGIDFNFGAVIRTYVDGSLALQTKLTWSDQGVMSSSDGASAIGDIGAQAAAAGINLNGLSGTGLVVPGSGGATVILHDTAQNGLGSFVFNTADGRDIRQDTAISLSLPDLAQYQSDTLRQQMQLNLQTSLNQAAQATLR